MKPVKITVKSLRQSAALVRVTHLRRVAVSRKAVQNLLKPQYQHIAKGNFNLPDLNIAIPRVILNRGGETSLTIDLKNGNHYQVNTICSNKEIYNKKRGLNICLTRLFSQMKENGDI